MFTDRCLTIEYTTKGVQKGIYGVTPNDLHLLILTTSFRDIVLTFV